MTSLILVIHLMSFSFIVQAQNPEIINIQAHRYLGPQHQKVEISKESDDKFYVRSKGPNSKIIEREITNDDFNFIVEELPKASKKTDVFSGCSRAYIKLEIKYSDNRKEIRTGCLLEKITGADAFLRFDKVLSAALM